MDTLDKILKTHPTPIHLRPHKGEFEVVIVTEYPHGYDVEHRYICDSLDDAFQKATGTPIGFSKPYAWRIYGYGQVKIAQSPNLHLLLPEEQDIQPKLPVAQGKPCALILEKGKGEDIQQRILIFDDHVQAMDIADHFRRDGWGWQINHFEHVASGEKPSNMPIVQKDLL